MKAPKRCLAEWAMCIAAAMEGKVLPNEPFCFGNVIGSGGIALAVLLAPATASAQSLSADRIGAIEQHIQRLEGELQALKRELGATRKQLRESRREVEAARARASQPASPPDQPLVQTRTEAPLAVSPTIAAESEPRLVKTSRNRFGLESADGRYSIALTGRLHFDAGLPRLSSAIPVRLRPEPQQRCQCAARKTWGCRQVRGGLELHVHLRFRRLV